MAIREFSPEGTPRAKIAFVGEVPSDEDLKRFIERKVTWEPSKANGPVTLDQLRDPDYIGKLDAVIWTQDPKNLKTLPKDLLDIGPRLLDHDVRVYVRPVTDDQRTAMPRQVIINPLRKGLLPAAGLWPEEWQSVPENLRERERSFLQPCVYIIDTMMSWGDIAALVCDRPAGPLREFELKFDEAALLTRFGSDGHDERVMLLKRAFWNCSELELISIDGGRSGAPVFKAYASLGAGLVQQGAKGAYPHLYFARSVSAKKSSTNTTSIAAIYSNTSLSISGRGCAAIAATSDQPKEFLWVTLSKAQSRWSPAHEAAAVGMPSPTCLTKRWEAGENSSALIRHFRLRPISTRSGASRDRAS